MQHVPSTIHRLAFVAQTRAKNQKLTKQARTLLQHTNAWQKMVLRVGGGHMDYQVSRHLPMA